MGGQQFKVGEMLDWQTKAEQLYTTYGRQWSKIASELKDTYFPEHTHHQAKEAIRSYIRRTDAWKQEEQELNKDKPKLVFADVHIPFHHPNYLKFLKATYKKYDCGQVICLGDLVDNHAISSHQKETCAKSPYDELDMAIEVVKEYTTAFPEAYLVLGNHDLRPLRQAASVGLGERFLKPLSQLLELPDTWILGDEFIIDEVLYKHGEGCAGVNGALNSALRERMSVCIGHFHALAGVKYSANKRDIVFGANVGCAIDIQAYAFAYGKRSKDRPILGCAVVFNSGHAEFIPMSSEYFRD